MYFMDYEGAEGQSQPFGAAIAIPVAAGISVAAVLEAIAFVVSAIGAAYLLIQAYEAAKARGFGVALAERLLTAGLQKLIRGAQKVLDVLNHFLQRARRLTDPPPPCAAAIAALLQTFLQLGQILSELITETRREIPQIPKIRMLMTRLGPLAERAGAELGTMLRVCGTLPS